MSRGTNWLNEIQLVDKPKPPVPTMRDVIVGLLKQTISDPNKVVRVPKARQSSIQSAYLWAREAGCVMSMETNGSYIYLRWNKRGK